MALSSIGMVLRWTFATMTGTAAVLFGLAIAPLVAEVFVGPSLPEQPARTNTEDNNMGARILRPLLICPCFLLFWVIIPYLLLQRKLLPHLPAGSDYAS